jgi:hypothetical protein
MEPSRINHISLDPNAIAIPAARECGAMSIWQWYGMTGSGGLGAQADDSAEPRACFNFWSENDHASWLHHFWLFEGAVEIANQNGPRLWVFMNGHLHSTLFAGPALCRG